MQELLAPAAKLTQKIKLPIGKLTMGSDSGELNMVLAGSSACPMSWTAATGLRIGVKCHLV
jgi:hypothetical protein